MLMAHPGSSHASIGPGVILGTWAESSCAPQNEDAT